jgi:hypothetical protein
MKTTHLHLVPPAPAPPWWEAPEFLALSEVRRAMVGGALPTTPAQTAEECARHAVFWALYEVEHIVHAYVRLLQAGESVRLRTGVYKHHDQRVDFNFRIIEHDDATITEKR